MSRTSPVIVPAATKVSPEFSVGSVRWVKETETEFARDRTFGYSASTMPEYVEEKTGGVYKAGDVIGISLKDIHEMAIDKMEAQLIEV